jgi:spore germination cell wall hydrolase CwlJ-like protein
MASAISNRYYDRVISVTRNTLLVLGLVLVAMILASVTKSKLDSLRARIAQTDATQLSVNEQVKQLECLAKNIYWEAAQEPFEGKVAVAQVTLNRVEDGRFGKDVCGVVYQKSVVYEKIICQFSWVCENNHQKFKPVYAKSYAESEEVAKRVYFEKFRLPSLNDALYYHATYVRPGWKKEKIAQIGQHIFYKE